MLTDFQNSFTIRLLSRKCVIKESLTYRTTPETRRYVKCKCQETTDNGQSETNVSFNNKF